jgi:hypothetical protein
MKFTKNGRGTKCGQGGGDCLEHCGWSGNQLWGDELKYDSACMRAG